MPSAIVTELIERVAKLEARVEMLLKGMYITMGAAVSTLLAVLFK